MSDLNKKFEEMASKKEDPKEFSLLAFFVGQVIGLGIVLVVLAFSYLIIESISK